MAIKQAFGTVAPAGADAKSSQTQTRMKQIESILGSAALNGTMTEAQMGTLIDEYSSLRDQDSARRTRTKALKYSACADSADVNRIAGAGGDQFSGQSYAARNLSPLDLDMNQMYDMFTACKHKQGYRAEVKAFGTGGGFGGPGGPPIGTKTTGQPISEGSPYPSGLLPSVIQPELTTELRFEYDRLADHIPTITIQAPSISYIVETGLTNPAAIVSEQGVKADLGIQTDTQICVPVKLAALASVTFEALQDFDYFAGMIGWTLHKAIVDIETDQLACGWHRDPGPGTWLRPTDPYPEQQP
jgi:hypothetical protein